MNFANVTLVVAGKGKPSADTAQALSGLHISTPSYQPEQPPPQPPRPSRAPVQDENDIEEEDEDDPFADRNAVKTPMVERGEPTW